MLIFIGVIIPSGGNFTSLIVIDRFRSYLRFVIRTELRSSFELLKQELNKEPEVNKINNKKKKKSEKKWHKQ